MSRKKRIRIGGAAAFLGDSSIAVPQLIRGGAVDYIILDYLAEVTMSFLGRAKAKRPASGYAAFFVNVVLEQSIRDIAEKGIRIITNAGGINPHGCRDAILALCQKNDLDLKVAVVEGDNLMPLESDLRGKGITEMFSGASWPGPMMSLNAYLGAGPIAEALDMGADLVITGRVVDSALTLGPLIHEFGWQSTDYDLLAAGSLAGHIIECGAQATGGLHTDWEQVPDWANIGYPVIECEADGTFTVTKPEQTGGIVTEAVVAEQMLYEIGDPQVYLLPDVVCDFSEVHIQQQGENRVLVSGARGYPPTGSYKVCGTYPDGYRCIAVLPVIGMNAVQKAERQAAAMIERTEAIFSERNLGGYRDTLVECIGAEASYGRHAKTRHTRETACKISLEHENPAALELFANEVFAPTTSMSPGTTGWFAGKPSVSPVIRIFSFLYPKADLTIIVSMGEQQRKLVVVPDTVFDETTIVRPSAADGKTLSTATREVPLVQLAWGRSGDKGDSCNIGIIARNPEYLPYIRAALTEEAVFDFMAHLFRGAVNPRVERFDLPGVAAVNFLLHESLGGGQMASLRLDPLAKGMAQQLLEFPIPVPEEWILKG